MRIYGIFFGRRLEKGVRAKESVVGGSSEEGGCRKTPAHIPAAEALGLPLSLMTSVPETAPRLDGHA
jgi:hypothetical protein